MVPDCTDLGETAEIHQQVLEFLDVGLGQRQVDALGAHAFAEHLGDVALQIVHRLAHLPGAAVADDGRCARGWRGW